MHSRSMSGPEVLVLAHLSWAEAENRSAAYWSALRISSEQSSSAAARAAA
jgi:hypothetical protein